MQTAACLMSLLHANTTGFNIYCTINMNCTTSPVFINNNEHFPSTGASLQQNKACLNATYCQRRFSRRSHAWLSAAWHTRKTSAPNSNNDTTLLPPEQQCNRHPSQRAERSADCCLAEQRLLTTAAAATRLLAQIPSKLPEAAGSSCRTGPHPQPEHNAQQAAKDQHAAVDSQDQSFIAVSHAMCDCFATVRTAHADTCMAPHGCLHGCLHNLLPAAAALTITSAAWLIGYMQSNCIDLHHAQS